MSYLRVFLSVAACCIVVLVGGVYDAHAQDTVYGPQRPQPNNPGSIIPLDIYTPPSSPSLPTSPSNDTPTLRLPNEGSLNDFNDPSNAYRYAIGNLNSDTDNYGRPRYQVLEEEGLLNIERVDPLLFGRAEPLLIYPDGREIRDGGINSIRNRIQNMHIDYLRNDPAGFLGLWADSAALR